MTNSIAVNSGGPESQVTCMGLSERQQANSLTSH